MVVGVIAAQSKPAWRTLERASGSGSNEVLVSATKKRTRSFRLLISSRPSGLRLNGGHFVSCEKDGHTREWSHKGLSLVTPATRHFSMPFADPDICTAGAALHFERDTAPAHGTIKMVLQARVSERDR
jgi:hypothetical protein